MSSARKAESNRVNAQKSTGPRTADGKHRTRFNAMSSGVYAKIQVLPHESELAYRALAQDLYDELQPQGPVEEALVQQIAAGIWRLRRFDDAEHAQLKQAIELQAMRRLYADAIQKIKDERINEGLVEMATERMFRQLPKAESQAEDLAAALAHSVSNMPRVQISTVVERLRQSTNKSILQNFFALERMQERRAAQIEVVGEAAID